MEDASDLAIWAYATAERCVLISKDEDFLHLANTRTTDARLVWIRLGNCRKATLLAAIGRLWPSIEAELNAGERIIEVR